MPVFHEGNLTARGLKTAIIVARFNSFITEHLLNGALDVLKRHEANDEDIEVYKVPGAFELPSLLRRVVDSNKFDAVICLGAVIRGGTPHFDYIASEVSKGVAQVGLEGKVPVVFGVLTTDTLEQAIERSGSKGGNKGFDAALSAIELANLAEKI